MNSSGMWVSLYIIIIIIIIIILEVKVIFAVAKKAQKKSFYPSSLPARLRSSVVEHHTGIMEVIGSNPMVA